MSRKIVIRPMENLSKIMVNKEKDTDNKVPGTTHKLRGPFINPKTGMLSVRLDLIDYDALGFTTTKPDSPAMLSMKAFIEETRMVETKEKAEDLSALSSKLKEKKSEFDKLNTLLGKYKTKLIDLNTEKVQIETDKKSTKSITTKITNTTKDINITEGKIEQLKREISDLKVDIQIANQSLNTDSATIKNGIENLKRLTAENRKSENELQKELAVSLGGKTLNLDPSNEFWKRFPLITLDNDDIIFDMEDPIQTLKFCILMGTGWLAENNSKEAIAKCQNAQYYIYDEDQEDLRKLEETNLIDRANTLRQQMDLETMKAILEIHGIQAYSLSETKIRNQISDLMKKDHRGFIDAAQMDNTELKKRAFVETLLNTKIIRRRADGRIIHGDIETGVEIGYSVEDAVRYIFASSQANLRMRLKKLLDTKVLGNIGQEMFL